MQNLSIKEIQNDMTRNGVKLYKSFYAYTLNVASIAAGAVESDTVNIENDSQFVWLKTSYFVDLAGAVQTNDSRVIPLIDMSLINSGSGRQFFDEAQPINNIAGQGNIPFILPAPFIFDRNANVNATFTNVSAATTYLNLRISLLGFRIYEYS